MASFSRSTVPFDLATSGKGPARGKSRSNTFNSSNSIPGKSTSTDKSTSIVAIAEGSGASKGTVGLAIMDLRQADIELSEFMDSPTFSRLKIKLLVADPVEIIVAENFYEKTRNAVMTEMIRSSIPNVVITNVHKRFFNRARGAELVTQLANAEISNCDRAVLKKEFCMQSCSALIKYVEHVQDIVFASKTLHFVYRDVEKTCLLDDRSWKNLEIDGSGSNKEVKTLLTVVDDTVTSGGARLLRSQLLQPSGDQAIIERRLDAVQELVENPHLVEKLRHVLGSASDLDNLFNIFVGNSREPTVQSADFNLTQLLRLKQVFSIVDPLRQLMRNFSSRLLKEKTELLNDDRIGMIREFLYERLQSDTTFSKRKSSLNVRYRKCYAIKEGVSVNLDVARRAYEELLQDVRTQEMELAQYLPEKNTRMAFSASRGFHYLWVCSHPTTVSLPPIFINVTRNRTSVTFTSRNLLRYNDRIDQSISEIMIATDVVVQYVITNVRPLIAALYHIMDAIATTDVLCSFAVYSSSRETVRPRFGNSVVVNQGRHPLLDASAADLVPNDTYMTADSRIVIITGPNMAGKSTYLKQVCQLCVLAQSGCFVPAKTAVLPVFLRISSRVVPNDNLSKNMSAFAVEMDDIALMLQYSGSRTLLVIDELARSTSTEEGIGICYAVLEKLVKLKAFAIFATHFLDIAALDVSYSTVENLHFPSQITYVNGQEQLSPSHRLHRGPYNGPLYGLELVELSTFPSAVIDAAREMGERLHEEASDKRAMSADTMLHQALERHALRLRQVVLSRNVASAESLSKCLIDIRNNLRLRISEANQDMDCNSLGF